jgi:hypothetical protein
VVSAAVLSASRRLLLARSSTTMSRWTAFTGTRMADVPDPVVALRAFYLAASLLVSRHRSACSITD